MIFKMLEKPEIHVWINDEEFVQKFMKIKKRKKSFCL